MAMSCLFPLTLMLAGEGVPLLLDAWRAVAAATFEIFIVFWLKKGGVSACFDPDDQLATLLRVS